MRFQKGQKVFFKDSSKEDREVMSVLVLGPLDESKYDKADVGQMYIVALPGGAPHEVFEDELSVFNFEGDK